MAMTTLNINVNVPSGGIDLLELTHQVTMYAQFVASQLGSLRLKKDQHMASNTSDELFFKEFLSLPYDNPEPAEKSEERIRKSHHFNLDRAINTLYDGE